MSTGGEESHLLTETETAVVAHIHNRGDIYWGGAATNPGNEFSSSNQSMFYTDAASAAFTSDKKGTHPNASGPASTAHNNMQPFLAMFMIIKT
jgi:microcystin-dependent protein